MAGTLGMTGGALLAGMSFTSGGSTTITPPAGGASPTPGVGYADSSLEYVVASSDPSLPNAVVFQVVSEGSTAPTNLAYLWADTATNPAIVKYWDTVATAWLPITQQTQAVAASVLTATAAAPSPGSSVSVSVASGSLFLQGMPVAIFDNSGVLAFGIVSAIAGNSITFERNSTDTTTAAEGYDFTAANASSLAIVGQPGSIGETGATGETIARSTTIDSPGFTSPAIGTSVSIPLVAADTFIVGDTLRVYDPTANSGAGGTDYYAVTSVSSGSVDGTRLSVSSDPLQLGSGYSWTAGLVASFMGVAGPAGANGANGTNGTNGTDGSSGSDAAISGASDKWTGDGSTTVFTLSQSAVGMPIAVFLGGVAQASDGSGGGASWSFAANAVTFAAAPGSGESVIVAYVVAGGSTGPAAALFALNAPSTISATTTAAQVFAFTPSAGNEVGAGALAVGDVLTFEMIGNYTTSSSPPDFTPSFGFGGAAILTGPAITLPASAASSLGITGRVVATVIRLGASGSIQFDGVVGVQTDSGGAYDQVYLGSALVTVDTTSAMVAAWGGAWSAVVAGNSMTANQATGLHAAANGGSGSSGGGGGGNTITATAGEAIAAQAATYVELAGGVGTAGNVYNTDSGSAAKSTSAFVAGFATGSASSGAVVTVQQSGVMSGFSGLTPGATYYIGTSGAITTTAPANAYIVGVALSATTLLINTRGAQGVLTPTAFKPPAAISSSDLALMLLFLEGSGTTTADTSPYARTFTISEGVWSTDDASLPALSLPTASSTASVYGTDANMPTGNSPRSLAFKFKTNLNGSNTIFAYGSFSPNEWWSLFGGGPWGVATVSYGYYGIPSLSDTDWNVVVMTYDGTTLECYLNGTLTGSGSLGGSPNTVLGGETTFGYGGGFGADNIGLLLDYAAVWGRVLTSDEIALLT